MPPQGKRTRYVLSIFRHYKSHLLDVSYRVADYFQGVSAFLKWIPRILRLAQFPLRESTREFPGGGSSQGMERVSRVVFINLDKRSDRKLETESELQRIGVGNADRFPAIQNSDGALGCAQSHLQILREFHGSGKELLWVCEDDIQFKGSREELNEVVFDFLRRPKLDVLCLGYRLRAPRLPISRNLAVANGIQTTLCYFVKAQASHAIIHAFERSERLLLSGANRALSSIDQQWKLEQSGKLLFCVPRKKLVHHRKSFSDIAGVVKDYSS